MANLRLSPTKQPIASGQITTSWEREVPTSPIILQLILHTNTGSFYLRMTETEWDFLKAEIETMRTK